MEFLAGTWYWWASAALLCYCIATVIRGNLRSKFCEEVGDIVGSMDDSTASPGQKASVTLKQMGKLVNEPPASLKPLGFLYAVVAALKWILVMIAAISVIAALLAYSKSA